MTLEEFTMHLQEIADMVAEANLEPDDVEIGIASEVGVPTRIECKHNTGNGYINFVISLRK